MSIIIRCKLFYVALNFVLIWDLLEDELCGLISLQKELDRPQSSTLKI
jgi:hypothetical protein